MEVFADNSNAAQPWSGEAGIASPFQFNIERSSVQGYDLALIVEIENEINNLGKAVARIDVRRPDIADGPFTSFARYFGSREEITIRLSAVDESAVAKADFVPSIQPAQGAMVTEILPDSYLNASYVCGKTVYVYVNGDYERCETSVGYQVKSVIDVGSFNEGTHLAMTVVHDIYGNPTNHFSPWTISRSVPTLGIDISGTGVQIAPGDAGFINDITLRARWSSAFTTGNTIDYFVDSVLVGSHNPTGLPPDAWYDVTFSTLSVENGSYTFLARGRDEFGHIVERSLAFDVFNEVAPQPPTPSNANVFNETEDNDTVANGDVPPLSTDETHGRYNANPGYNECNATETCDSEGDCARDSDCTGILVYGDDNGVQFGYPRSMDICVAASCMDSIQNLGEFETDCGGTSSCGACQIGRPGEGLLSPGTSTHFRGPFD